MPCVGRRGLRSAPELHTPILVLLVARIVWTRRGGRRQSGNNLRLPVLFTQPRKTDIMSAPAATNPEDAAKAAAAAFDVALSK